MPATRLRMATQWLLQFLLGCALIGTAPAGAQTPAPGGDAAVASFPHWNESLLSTPRYQSRVENGVRVPMRDGVELLADVYRPDAAGRFPSILVRTPYNMRSPDDIANAKRYATYGYAVVMMDVRGRFLSSAAPYYA